MQFGKILPAMLGLVGIIAIAYGGYSVYDKVKKGELKILGESTTKHPVTIVNKSIQQSTDPGFSGDAIAIPTLQQSIQMPTMALVDCWKLREDGKTYEYNFGQILKDDCTRKIALWKEAEKKQFNDTIEKQTANNEQTFMSLPTLPPSSNSHNGQFNIQ